ncbi:hypothetical protein VXQ18_03455 [Brucella abortus]|nr:hypothetical protein [Brucella abortus]
MKVDGTFYEIADVPPLDKKYKHDIDVVVDRVVVRPDLSTRLADSLETCLKLAGWSGHCRICRQAPASGRNGGRRFSQ